MARKVVFIELYIRKDDGDYQWCDNHGELIRCPDCKHCEQMFPSGRLLCNRLKWAVEVTDRDYCSFSVKREVEE